MATRINFYLNETLINPPKNWREIAIELNYDLDKNQANSRLTITDWDFVNENNSVIKKWLTDGLTSGVGVFEGIPFRIEVERSTGVEQIFDGYLDLSQETAFGRVLTNVKAVENYSVDWLNDVADSFSFEYLHKELGLITTSDFKYMPYVLNSVPDYYQAAIGVLSVYVMVKEIKDAIQRIAEFVADMPIFYVFSSYIKLILYILYLIVLIIALIKLIKQVILLLIQPVKYHACMSVRDQLSKGCEHLGLIFKCPILETAPYDNLTEIPRKYFNPVNKKEKQILGFTDPSIEQIGYHDGTFGDLLRATKQLINGKIIFKGNELWLVRKDQDLGTAVFTLDNLDNPEFRLNTNEFNSNMLISFQPDFSDKNTIQEYTGTSYQLILRPQRVVNSKFVLMKGLDEIRLPFALAKRKETLSTVESILDDFLKAVGNILGALVDACNAVIGVLNQVISKINDVLRKLSNIGIDIDFELPDIPLLNMPQFSDTISNRIGMLMIEVDSFNTPKLFILSPSGTPKNNKINPDNSFLVSAKYLFENFYFLNTFLPTSGAPNGNQYFLKRIPEHKFLFDNYLKVKDNNRIFTHDGQEALIDSLKWNIFEQKAEINYRINKIYTNNLTPIFYESSGI